MTGHVHRWLPNRHPTAWLGGHRWSSTSSIKAATFSKALLWAHNSAIGYLQSNQAKAAKTFQHDAAGSAMGSNSPPPKFNSYPNVLEGCLAPNLPRCNSNERLEEQT